SATSSVASVVAEPPPRPGPIVELTPRCALYRDGRARCWEPAPSITALEGIAAIAGDERETWAVLRDGSVHCDDCRSDWLEQVRARGRLERVAVGGQGRLFATRDGEVLQLRRGKLEALAALPPSPTALVAMRDSACAFYAGYQPFCWGDNNDGELVGGGGYQRGPAVQPHLHGARGVAAGYGHLCYIDGAGAVICRGSSDEGGLGDGQRHYQDEVTVKVGEARGIVGGFNTTCVVLATGRVSCWGRDQSAFDVMGAKSGPIDVGLEGVERLAIGGHRICAAHRDGKVTCFGNLSSRAFVPVVGLSGATRIAAGDDTSCALRGEGELWCWGRWGDSAVGRARLVHDVDDAVALAMGKTPGRSWDGCVARKSGRVTCWDGPELSDPGLDDAVSVAMVHHHACALRRGGKVSCWGDHAHGGLGAPDEYLDRAREVPGISDAVEVVVSGDSSCILDRRGAVWCWGDNDSGLLALGHDRRMTTIAPQRSRMLGAKTLASGPSHTCALRLDGQVACWGFNGWKETFFTSQQVQPTPLPYPGVKGVVQLSPGSTRTCAVDDAERLLCWGSTVGEIDSVFEDRDALPRTRAVAGIVEVATGYDHACLRLASGEVHCWGDNGHAELGNGAGPFGALVVLPPPDLE
ncbi:MAG: hypothetical protein KC731_14565, partial [Myxococcales bacterium]|nr:hypothetical protein [Myxococcales bacterium]